MLTDYPFAAGEVVGEQCGARGSKHLCVKQASFVVGCLDLVFFPQLVGTKFKRSCGKGLSNVGSGPGLLVPLSGGLGSSRSVRGIEDLPFGPRQIERPLSSMNAKWKSRPFSVAHERRLWGNERLELNGLQGSSYCSIFFRVFAF